MAAPEITPEAAQGNGRGRPVKLWRPCLQIIARPGDASDRGERAGEQIAQLRIACKRAAPNAVRRLWNHRRKHDFIADSLLAVDEQTLARVRRPLPFGQGNLPVRNGTRAL